MSDADNNRRTYTMRTVRVLYKFNELDSNIQPLNINPLKPTITGILVIAFILTLVAFKHLHTLNYTR